MPPDLNPVAEFETAVNQHFRPLADRLHLQFTRSDGHFFILSSADVSVHVRFFEPYSTAGYDVFVGISPQRVWTRDPPGERGLIWFIKYLGLNDEHVSTLLGGMPENRIHSVAEIPRRVEELSALTDLVFGRVFAGGWKFWPPFYAFVEAEIAKLPKRWWNQGYTKSDQL